jgi:hypothetical protein
LKKANSEQADAPQQYAYGEQYQETEEAHDRNPMLIRDCICTTYNLFGSGLVEIKLGGTSHWVQAVAVSNHCGAYREQADGEDIVDLGCEDTSPLLARVFFQAISPFPRGSLPTHDFVPNPDTDLNSEDVANVILRDDPVPQLIDWDVCTCIEMYKLATVMKSPAVQDMVADKIRTIYLAHCKEGTESGFDFPLDFLNSLTPDQDAPLLRLIVDILLDRSRK